MLNLLAELRPQALLELFYRHTCPPAPAQGACDPGHPPLHHMLLPAAVSAVGWAEGSKGGLGMAGWPPHLPSHWGLIQASCTSHPCPLAAPLQRYLESILSPQQLQKLSVAYTVYKQRMAEARQSASGALLEVQWTSALHSATWHSSQQAGAAGGSSAERGEVSALPPVDRPWQHRSLAPLHLPCSDRNGSWPSCSGPAGILRHV